MYPVPAPSRAYHPCFTRDSVQAILVVPQGRALVNSKPYPVCLFFWRGRPSTDAPGVQISILQRRRREHLHLCQAAKSGAPPHKLNRRRYGAGTLSLAFQGERPVAYPRNTSGVQSPDSKRRIVLLLAVSIHSRPVRRLTPQPTDRGRADCPSLKGEVTEKDFIGSAVLSTTLFP